MNDTDRDMNAHRDVSTPYEDDQAGEAGESAGLVHLATHNGYISCQTRAVELSTRRTRYPALVTCSDCRRLFRADQLRATDPNADQDPPGVE